MIDEIDKMGADFRGDPASAMLEVLDPEQHSTFRDHYLDLPFDLAGPVHLHRQQPPTRSPAALLDRMDVLQLSGYTQEEKLGDRQARAPKQIAARLCKSRIAIPDKTLLLVIRSTPARRERTLERQLATLCRKVATLVATGHEGRIRVDEARAREWLGPRRFSAEARKRTADPGVATGLAYTAVGGDALHRGDGASGPGTAHDHRPARRGDAGVGAGRAPRGSARTRTRWARQPAGSQSTTCTSTRRPAQCQRTGPPPGEQRHRDRLTRPRRAGGRRRRNDGRDHPHRPGAPIGGVRERSSRQRAGLRRVILPLENEPDLEDLPPEARGKLEFVPSTTSRTSSTTPSGSRAAPCPPARTAPAGCRFATVTPFARTLKGKIQ